MLGLGLKHNLDFVEQGKKERSLSLETGEFGYRVPLSLGFVDLSYNKYIRYKA